MMHKLAHKLVIAAVVYANRHIWMQNECMRVVLLFSLNCLHLQQCALLHG